MEKGGYIYILTNLRHTTFYIGVTSNLISRIYEHKNRIHPNSFTARYNLSKLIYWEGFHSIDEAIEREKQLKAGSRRKKEELIKMLNPEWMDLYDKLEF